MRASSSLKLEKKVKNQDSSSVSLKVRATRDKPPSEILASLTDTFQRFWYIERVASTRQKLPKHLPTFTNPTGAVTASIYLFIDTSWYWFFRQLTYPVFIGHLKFGHNEPLALFFLKERIQLLFLIQSAISLSTFVFCNILKNW